MANVIGTGKRILFSEVILRSISEMIEVGHSSSQREAKKKVEEKQNNEKEEGSVPLQAVESAGLALYIKMYNFYLKI